MNGRTWLLAGVALLAVIVAIVYEGEPSLQTLQTPEVKAKNERAAPSVTAPALDPAGARPAASPGRQAAVEAIDDDAKGADTAFRTDAAGELVIDEQTRLNMEVLIAQAESRELEAEVREQTAHLPPAAARQAEEFVQKFSQYQQVQRQTYPPRDASFTEDDAIRELEGLHALREAHFGPEIAQRLYGREEAIAREMIELMRIENDQSLTTEEKLERAQVLRERLPGVAAIEKSNRDVAREREEAK